MRPPLLDTELKELSNGSPMMQKLLSSLASSCIRQQLRRTLEQDRARNVSLLEGLPRGRGVGFLTKCDSAAKVLSCALYEACQLAPMLREPSLRHLLTVSEREARDALNELPQPLIDDLLTLHEAHAALRHLLDGTKAAPRMEEHGFAHLKRIITYAREGGCVEEAHFFPLENLNAFKALLDAHQNGVPSLVRLLQWASPQVAANQRTRAHRASIGGITQPAAIAPVTYTSSANSAMGFNNNNGTPSSGTMPFPHINLAAVNGAISPGPTQQVKKLAADIINSPPAFLRN